MKYEVRVAGVFPEALLLEMNGVHVAVLLEHTVLWGPMPNPAALHGVINRLQDLGLDLIELRRLTVSSDQAIRVPSEEER